MAENKSSKGAEAQGAELLDGEAGALQIGPTELGMVRIILTTESGVVELDFPPEEAVEIAQEMSAAAEIASGSAKKAR